MATLQKFKILATQCGVAQSPTRSPRTSPLIRLPRKKTTLRMFLTRNPSRRRESPPAAPPVLQNVVEKRDKDLISQRHKLKDLFVSSSPLSEDNDVVPADKISDGKKEVLCTRKLTGLGGEPGFSRPVFVGFRNRLLLRRAWRPILLSIPEQIDI